jgi:hypothetical protein
MLSRRGFSGLFEHCSRCRAVVLPTQFTPEDQLVFLERNICHRLVSSSTDENNPQCMLQRITTSQLWVHDLVIFTLQSASNIHSCLILRQHSLQTGLTRNVAITWIVALQSLNVYGCHPSGAYVPLGVHSAVVSNFLEYNLCGPSTTQFFIK